MIKLTNMRGLHFSDNPPASAPAPASVPITPPAAPPAPAPTPAAPAAPAPTPAPAAPAGETSGEKALREATERIAKLEETNLANLRARIAVESGINAGAAEFLTATDEAGIKAQAEKLKGFAPAAPAAPQVPGTPAAPTTPIGSVTNPGSGNPAPTLDERIATAEKSGSRYESLELKLQKLAGG